MSPNAAYSVLLAAHEQFVATGTGELVALLDLVDNTIPETKVLEVSSVRLKCFTALGKQIIVISHAA